MKVMVKFFQITSSNGLLYALDGNGQIWERDGIGNWFPVPHPMREETKPIPTPTPAPRQYEDTPF